MPDMIPSTIQNFALDGKSIVFVVGAYAGDVAQYYVNHYDPYLYLFEPQTKFITKLEERFAKNPKVKVFEFGLGDKTGIFQMANAGEYGCSFVMIQPQFLTMGLTDSLFPSPHELGKIVDIAEFLKGHQIDHIDLLYLNCEGSEYNILQRLIELDLLRICRFLMVQFHPEREGNQQYDQIRRDIDRTHQCRDNYGHTWSTWIRKETMK